MLFQNLNERKGQSVNTLLPHQAVIIMDYEGQKLAELLFYWIICSFGAVGWVIGYIHQDFTLVFYAWLVGVGISVVRQFPYCSRYEIQ